MASLCMNGDQLTQWVLTLANCLQPSTPHSRPKPLRATPPEGKVGSDLGMSLTKPSPHLTRSITSSPRDALNTDPPSPQLPLLANLMACSSLSTLKREKTGPKSSSSQGSSEPSMRVMGKKGFVISVLCQVILQEVGRFLSWAVRLSWRSSRARGPILVSLSMGSPNLTLASPSMSLLLKASQWLLWTMNRLGEKQTWPALAHLPARAYWTARLTSPSSSTMRGSLPPSSITARFKYLPAFSAMRAPPLDEPVKLTPQTESRLKIWSIWSWEVQTFWYSPLLKPALAMHSSTMRPTVGQESALRVRRTLPRRRLGSPPLKLRQKGKLKGTRQQMVPRGRYLTRACFLASACTRCGRIGAQFSLQYLQNLMALLTSASASLIGLPISHVTHSVASLNRSWMHSPTRLMIAARSWMLLLLCASKPCSALASLWSSSSLERNLKVSLTLEVKGFLDIMLLMDRIQLIQPPTALPFIASINNHEGPSLQPQKEEGSIASSALSPSSLPRKPFLVVSKQLWGASSQSVNLLVWEPQKGHFISIFRAAFLRWQSWKQERQTKLRQQLQARMSSLRGIYGCSRGCRLDSSRPSTASPTHPSAPPAPLCTWSADGALVSSWTFWGWG